MKKQYEKRNLAMMMDLYELTMAGGYYEAADLTTRVAFDVFYRKNPDVAGFSIFAGLEQVLDYLEEFHFEKDDIEYFRSLGYFKEEFLHYLEEFRFRGDVYAFPEGAIMYPNEPVITIVAPVIDAQLIETYILAQVNHQSLIATKAQRIVRAAEGRAVSDFSARRVHNVDAAVYGARACMIGGVKGTATVLAGQMFGLPVGGTMAHSWVMFYPDELTAFRTYAKIYPSNCILLVDTYDALKSGVPNAIQVFKEMEEAGLPTDQIGIRLDSGDLAYLSRKARAMLDKAGFRQAKIVASNSLDEYTIESLLKQGACIDSFGVGERMGTAKSEPVFGAVYKISAVEESGTFSPRIKVSETLEKITNPGLKDVWRIYDKDGNAVADLITKKGEEVDLSAPYRYVDPEMPWKNRSFCGCSARKLQELVMKDGKRTKKDPSINEIASYVKKQLKYEIWEEEQRFENPHKHYIDMSQDYYEMKMSMLHEMRSE